MHYRQLGNSGLIVSELALGTMTFGRGNFHGLEFAFDQQAATELVHEVLDLGINFFDTADSYSNGACETILGHALKGKRQDAIVSTKYAFRAGEQPFNAGTNAKHLLQQAERSLRALQTDYIDVLLLHNDDPITPIDETLRALEQLVQQGKVRYIGLSNFSAWKAGTMTQRQRDLHYQPFTASQMHYSILNRHVEREFIPMSRHHGIGMMVWSPLSSGFLTGKYTRENPAPEGARLNSFDLGLFDRDRAYDVVAVIQEIAEQHETSPVSVSIAWLLSKAIVSSVIIGVSKRSQLDANLAATGLKLPQAAIDRIDQLTQPDSQYPQSFEALQDEVLRDARRSFSS